jgi:hypothetical protein
MLIKIIYTQSSFFRTEDPEIVRNQFSKLIFHDKKKVFRFLFTFFVMWAMLSQVKSPCQDGDDAGRKASDFQFGGKPEK